MATLFPPYAKHELHCLAFPPYVEHKGDLWSVNHLLNGFLCQ